MRRSVGRRSLGRATAGPGAKAGVGTGRSTAQPTTPPDDRRDAIAEAAPPTEAHILVGVASWLAASRDWLASAIDAADGESVTFRRADAERMREGLARCVGWLDTLTVDPAQLPPAAPDTGEPTPTTPGTTRLQ